MFHCSSYHWVLIAWIKAFYVQIFNYSANVHPIMELHVHKEGGCSPSFSSTNPSLNTNTIAAVVDVNFVGKFGALCSFAKKLSESPRGRRQHEIGAKIICFFKILKKLAVFFQKILLHKEVLALPSALSSLYGNFIPLPSFPVRGFFLWRAWVKWTIRHIYPWRPLYVHTFCGKSCSLVIFGVSILGIVTQLLYVRRTEERAFM